MGIQRSTRTGYRPSSDVAVEKVQASISAIFAKMVKQNQKDWASLTPFVTFAYNTAVHSVTKYSPVYLMLLRDPVTSIDFCLEQPSAALPTDLDEYTEQMLTLMREAYKLVSTQLRCAFGRNKKHYNARVKEVRFQEGDFVWFFSPKGTKGLSKKWELRTYGPFRIMCRINMVNYVIQKYPHSKPFICHVDRIRQFRGILPDCWRNLTGIKEWPPNSAAEDRIPYRDSTFRRGCQLQRRNTPCEMTGDDFPLGLKEMEQLQSQQMVCFTVPSTTVVDSLHDQENDFALTEFGKSQQVDMQQCCIKPDRVLSLNPGRVRSPKSDRVRIA
jgi:hypothetical protein